MTVKKSARLQEATENMAKGIFGMSQSEARKKRICISCKKKIKQFRDGLSEREYLLSGLCQECQDEIFK